METFEVCAVINPLPIVAETETSEERERWLRTHSKPLAQPPGHLVPLLSGKAAPSPEHGKRRECETEDPGLVFASVLYCEMLG